MLQIFYEDIQNINNFLWQWFCYYKHRQQHGSFVLKDGIQLYNNYVVPYNRELLLRYHAHINVEICCQSMLIKYLFKYVSKGSDRCRMAMQKENDDEIKAYLNFQFPIHSRNPSVECLQVHLPSQHNMSTQEKNHC